MFLIPDNTDIRAYQYHRYLFCNGHLVYTTAVQVKIPLYQYKSIVSGGYTI